MTRASRACDAGNNVNGRKRHIIVDTTGLLLVVLVTAANAQDRDPARLLQSLNGGVDRWQVGVST